MQLCELLLARLLITVTAWSRCCRKSTMIRKTFGCDEVAKEDWCVSEIDI